MPNCWLNSYGKFGGATRRRFLAICEKPEGVDIRPPGRARVKGVPTLCRSLIFTASTLVSRTDYSYLKTTLVSNAFKKKHTF